MVGAFGLICSFLFLVILPSGMWGGWDGEGVLGSPFCPASLCLGCLSSMVHWLGFKVFLPEQGTSGAVG